MPSLQTFHRPESTRTKAKRALRSLAIGVAVPLALTVAIILCFGSGRKYHGLPNKPFWLPPLWLIHLATTGSSLFMGLAAWLVWADGGLSAKSDALPLYVAHVSLSIVWHPLVLVMGAHAVALVTCMVNLGTIFLCYLRFRRVNPFAEDLAKPCVVWAAYMSLVSFKLLFH